MLNPTDMGRRQRAVFCCIGVIVLLCCAFNLIGRLPASYRFTLNFTFNRKETNSFVPPKCTPKMNIAFIKTHKTGSTTVMNILQRFGYTRNLTFVLPRHGLVYLGPHRLSLQAWSILPPPEGKSFNILCNHVVYNKKTFGELMPKDTVYFSILRHPLQRFLSAFWYYSDVHPQEYLSNIKGKNKVRTFLQNPRRYEPGVEYTNNAMATDLGLSPLYFHKRAEMDRYISEIGKDFKLVMILEYFDVSLVLLKRHLCWDMKDILYLPKNERKHFQSDDRYLSDDDVNRHRLWDEADYRFYDHFYAKLLKSPVTHTDEFWDEVASFRKIKQTVAAFCLRQLGLRDKSSTYTVAEDKFNPAFVVSHKDCEVMLINQEEKFTRQLIEKQYS